MGQDVVATQGATSGEHFPNEKYISIEKLRHSGTLVATPVWLVGLVYVGTFPKTGKVKRLRTNQRGQVPACTFRGHVKGEWREGEARILDAGAEADRAQRLLNGMYGLIKRVTDWSYRRTQGHDTALAIQPQRRQRSYAEANKPRRKRKPSVAMASCDGASGRQIEAAVAIVRFSAVNDSMLTAPR